VIITETVSFHLKGTQSMKFAIVQRSDREHTNAKLRWAQMGKPEYLDAKKVAELHPVSKPRSQPLTIGVKDGQPMIEVDMPPQAVAAIRFEWR
jgi:xylan 1,4-beta-xylosidase